MREVRRPLVRWLILLLFVWAVDYIVDGAASAVFGWLAQVAWESLTGLGASPTARGLVSPVTILAISSLRFFAIGFAYAWLMDVPWPKAGAASAATFLLLQWLPLLRSWGFSAWFAVDALAAFAAALGGARYFQEQRHNQRLSDVKDAILSSRLFALAE